MYGALAYGWGTYGQAYVDETATPPVITARGYASASDQLASAATSSDEAKNAARSGDS